MSSGKKRQKPTRTPAARAKLSSGLQESIADRIDKLKAALGDPFAEDHRLAHYRAALDAADASSRSHRASPREDFLARVDAFLAAHEIALSIVDGRSSRGDWDNVTSRAEMLFNVESIRRGHVRSMSGLNSLESAFLTEWNEAPPAETREFWEAVQAADLPYVRRDLLAEIFNRGRITSREHYEFAVDVLGVAEDDGLLDSGQVEQLSRWIDAYERR